MTLSPAPAPPAAPVSTDEIIVSCVKVSKVFRDFWLRSRVKAVENVDLEIRRGEVFGLLGPNGSGKSTTIKMILGLLYPSQGRIAVFGKRPEHVATKSMIGYLPEESYLYRFLNARETLDYYARLFYLNRVARQRRIDMLLDMVGLTHAQYRPLGEYSKGMQRRIGLAQALINDPQFLILDEPTTGLDPIGSRQIRDLILELSRRGKTILLCSHLLSDVEDVCHRAAIMYGGKVRAAGTMAELLTRPGLTTIQTPELDAASLQRLEEFMARMGKPIERVEQPRQRLEEFFLDLVEKAQSEGAATAGAKSGGRIADFLVTGSALASQSSSPAEAREVIENLINPKEPAASATPEQAQPIEAAQLRQSLQADAQAQDSVIAELTRPEPEAESDIVEAQMDEGVEAAGTGEVFTAGRQADLSVIEGLLDTDGPSAGAPSAASPFVSPLAGAGASVPLSQPIGQESEPVAQVPSPALASDGAAGGAMETDSEPLPARPAQPPARDFAASLEAMDRFLDQEIENLLDEPPKRSQPRTSESPDPRFLDAMRQVPPLEKDGGAQGEKGGGR